MMELDIMVVIMFRNSEAHYSSRRISLLYSENFMLGK